MSTLPWHQYVVLVGWVVVFALGLVKAYYDQGETEQEETAGVEIRWDVDRELHGTTADIQRGEEDGADL